MRPKCERGWHWSGRAYICETCFPVWKREVRIKAKAAAAFDTFQASCHIPCRHTGCEMNVMAHDAPCQTEMVDITCADRQRRSHPDLTFAAHYNRHPPTP